VGRCALVFRKALAGGLDPLVKISPRRSSEKHFETGDKLKEGWAYPGDIGTIDEGGFLRLLGRTSDLIIRGGVNVHPSEVEAAIAEHEGGARSRGGWVRQFA